MEPLQIELVHVSMSSPTSQHGFSSSIQYEYVYLYFSYFFADNSHLVQCLGLSLWMVLINERMIISTSPNQACPCINVLTYQSTRLQHSIISSSIQYEYLDQHFAKNTKTKKWKVIMQWKVKMPWVNVKEGCREVENLIKFIIFVNKRENFHFFILISRQCPLWSLALGYTWIDQHSCSKVKLYYGSSRPALGLFNSAHRAHQICEEHFTRAWAQKAHIAQQKIILFLAISYSDLMFMCWCFSIAWYHWF